MVSTSSAADSKPRRRWLGATQILLVAALVLIAFLYARAPGRGADAPPTLAAGRQETPRPLVRVIRPAVSSTVLRVAATGAVQVRNHVALMPQVSGRVVSLSPSLRRGGTFQADEELLVMDRRDFQLAYDRANADVAAALSTLMLRQAEGEAAEANYALLHPDADVPPLIAKKPQIAQAKAQLEAARARADIAALELKRTTFSLPFNGRVTESSAEIGQMLSRGQSFGQVFALDAVEIVVPVPPDDLARLQGAAGRRATVRSADRSLPAVVERIAAELDARSRFATLYLTFSGSDDAEPLPPGTFVDVNIEGPELADTFLLPEAAEQIGGSVWIVAHGALQSITPHTFGRDDAGWLVAAFDPADGVVLGAVPGASAGLPVQVQTAAAAETDF